MRKYYIILFILLCQQSACGQSPVNSILQLEEMLAKTSMDTQRVNILNKLAAELFPSHPEKTKLYGSRAKVLADSLDYEKGTADASYSLSLISKLKADYAQELDYHFKSLKVYQRINDSPSIARTFNALGLAYHQLQDNELAREFFEKSLNIYEATGDQEGTAGILRRIGNIELNNKNFQAALKAYYAALETERKINHEEGVADCMNNIGFTYYEQAQYDSALYYLHQSFEITSRINNLLRLPAAYRNLGQVYLTMGRTDEALALANKGLPLAEQLQLRQAIIEATKLLSDIHQKKGDYAKALHYLSRYNEERDSVLNKENNLQYARLYALFKTEEKEKEIELLKKDQQLAQLTHQLTVAGLGAILIFGGLIIYYQRGRIRREREIVRKNTEIHEAQQALTRSELDNKHLSEQQLQQDLEFRHKELLTYTLNLAQKNALMENLREGIRELLANTDKDSHLKLSRLIKSIDYSLETEKDWDEFRMYFEKLHSSFFENLKTQFPDLTQSDLKLCALISLNLSMKEMAELMGISPESVKMARHRLRKKLNLATEENLVEFVAGFK